MISACLEAHRITRDKQWYKEARCAFDWFLGRNDLNLPIYDPTTGGCRDGLHPDRPNENQGAESSLAFLQSVLELRLDLADLRVVAEAGIAATVRRIDVPDPEAATAHRFLGSPTIRVAGPDPRPACR